jgi:hypothetical protein
VQTGGRRHRVARGGGLFELDEPAARSHLPPGWSIQTIEIEPSGKAPMHYGPDTYRFGSPLPLSVLFTRRDWTMVNNDQEPRLPYPASRDPETAAPDIHSRPAGR